ncbi:MAG: hypothetical protein ACR2JB_01125 [Bryobacteraceae bacterium]
MTEDCRAITSFVEESIAAWHVSSNEFPKLGRQYSADAQQERERLFDRALAIAETELQAQPETASERKEVYSRLTSAVARLATLALDLDDPSLEFLLRDDFSKIGKDLAMSARRFDASVCLSDILQACRNAWTACGLQPLLGQPIQLTPAIFAYSMLYPYSDNYLDDARVSRGAKLGFSSRFRRRLAGDGLPPADALEEAVWRLVSLIESQYARSDYSQIYDCLLDIHHAQENSIHQLGRSVHTDEMDLLSLTFAKGGTSVLADAYLAVGSLTGCEARFAFAWGVLLQMADDLDDLPLDRQHGFLNLFSQAAEREPLDALTNRTLNFGQSVMQLMYALPNGSASFKELLRRNSTSLITRAAAHSEELYTKGYLEELETYSPLRFHFLRQRQQQFAASARSYAKFLEAFLLSEDNEPQFAAQLCDRSHAEQEPLS